MIGMSGQWLIVQMVERVTADPRVLGSNPAEVHHRELEIIQQLIVSQVNGGSVVGINKKIKRYLRCNFKLDMI